MLMLIDTPDPRYRGDPEGDGPGRPHLGVRAVALLGGCAICLYLARFVPVILLFFLLVGALFAFLAALLLLWDAGDGPPPEEP